jgi:hypothetical protein
LEGFVVVGGAVVDVDVLMVEEGTVTTGFDEEAEVDLNDEVEVGRGVDEELNEEEIGAGSF